VRERDSFLCVGWVIDCEFWSRKYPASSFALLVNCCESGAHLVGIKGVTIVARVPAELLQINAPCSSRPFATLLWFDFFALAEQMTNTCISTVPFHWTRPQFEFFFVRLQMHKSAMMRGSNKRVFLTTLTCVCVCGLLLTKILKFVTLLLACAAKHLRIGHQE
jgi:hypothetical protein